MSGTTPHVAALDGIRAHSIVLVLATHLLPLNALWAPANDSLGYLGMALFFVLSGYLIGTQLAQRTDCLSFVVSRLTRIVPLAWLCVVIMAWALALNGPAVASHLLFYANLSPGKLQFPFDHYWSLCVEVQFYALAALLLCLPARTMSVALPALLVAVTVFRIATDATLGSVTWIRVDDILGGATLALLLQSRWSERVRAVLRQPLTLWAASALLCAACIVLREHENPLTYFRSYAVATWLGAVICQPRSRTGRWMASARWRYLAQISYALYLIHLPLTATWLGSGTLLEKYLKRPLLVAVAIGLAHLSTFHFENQFIQLGRRFRDWRRRRIPAGRRA